MFLGQFEHTIDDKGRMTIPAKFRDSLVDGAYITQGFDENLIILTAPIFETIYQKVNQISMTDPIARQLRRLFFAHADMIEVDKSGRILLPQYLRQVAHLESAATVVGVGDHFEIWSPTIWETHFNDLQDKEANAQRFATLDLSLRP